MNKLVKRLLTGTLAFATILTALPVTAVHASGNQYWTESAERVGYIEQIMNDGSIKSTFHEGHMKVEGETAYCVDINTNFKNGYKTRSDASTRMSSDQIADVALLWSSIFVTLMANKIGGLQFGIYRNCQISSRVFHTAVAALPLTKANRSDFE